MSDEEVGGGGGGSTNGPKIEWKDIYCAEVLKQSNGSANPGEVTAVLGPECCGKTTLLQTLAGRSGRQYRGSILVDGAPATSAFRSECGYVGDRQLPSTALTVHEHLFYAARLRMKASTYTEVRDQVENVIDTLGLSECSAMSIGVDGKGITPGQLRRVAIGVELVASPGVLILDEPLTGLDAASALIVARVLKTIARTGITVLLSLRQPSTKVFALLDVCVFIDTEGYTLYAGTMPSAESYFAQLGYQCPRLTSLCDYVVEEVCVASHDQRMAISSHFITVLAQEGRTSSAPTTPALRPGVPKVSPTKRFLRVVRALPWESFVLCRRGVLTYIRQKKSLALHYVGLFIQSLLFGIIFFQAPYDIPGLQTRVDALFVFILLLVVHAYSSFQSFANEQDQFLQEVESGSYSVLSYLLSKVGCDLFFLRVFPPMLSGFFFYFMVGLDSDVGKFIVFQTVLVFTSVNASLLWAALACLPLTRARLGHAAVAAMTCCVFFSGGVVNMQAVPLIFSIFVLLSPFSYSLEALVNNEVLDQAYTLKENADAAGTQATGDYMGLMFGFNMDNVGLDFTGLFVWPFFLLAGAYMGLHYRARRAQPLL